MTAIRLLFLIFFSFSLLISVQINPGGSGRPSSLAYDVYDGPDTFAAQTADCPCPPKKLQNEFYRHSCPDAEKIIKKTMYDLSTNDSNIAPAFIRLAFHDCFVQGCDASVLLESVEGHFVAEKEALPNKNSLRGYEYIDIIKLNLESACPLTVSCADIIVLSAREAVRMMGGPNIALETGRRDSTTSIASLAEASLPSPFDGLHSMIRTFRKKGFHAGEMVSLLGAHTIGRARCRFFEQRLYNFNNTGMPDPNINPEFLMSLRSTCPANSTSHSEPSGNFIKDPAVPMDNGSDYSFDAHYYQNVRDGKGVLFVDQALMGGKITRDMVEVYANDEKGFNRDFSRAMSKLFNLNVLSGNQGEIRKQCWRLNANFSAPDVYHKDPESGIVP